MNRVEKVYSAEYRAILGQLKDEPLVFRRNAHQAIDAFTKTDRRFVKKLETTLVNPVDLYTQWDASLEDLHKIERARQAKPFTNALGRHLVLEEQASVELAARLVDERIEDLHISLIDTVYSADDHKARAAVRVLLANDEDAVRRQWLAYVTYTLYTRIARDNSVVLADRQVWFLLRPLRSMREKYQVRTFTRQTKRSLKEVQTKIAGLKAQDGGILGSIFALNVSLVGMHDTHRRYEKEMATLSAKQQQSAAKRLAVYEKHIASVRTKHLESLPATDSLRDIRQSAQDLDTVLARIFDMGSRSYNELMSRMKYYRELVREQERLSRRIDLEG